MKKKSLSRKRQQQQQQRKLHRHPASPARKRNHVWMDFWCAVESLKPRNEMAIIEPFFFSSEEVIATENIAVFFHATFEPLHFIHNNIYFSNVPE